jgi:hypothetical protein
MERGLANHLWTIQELTASSSAAAPQPNRNVSRKGAKAAKKQALSFRPTGEIFPRSLAFCSGSQARHFAFLGVLARVNPRLTGEEFAQGAETFKHGSIKYRVNCRFSDTFYLY